MEFLILEATAQGQVGWLASQARLAATIPLSIEEYKIYIYIYQHHTTIKFVIHTSHTHTHTHIYIIIKTHLLPFFIPFLYNKSRICFQDLL